MRGRGPRGAVRLGVCVFLGLWAAAAGCSRLPGEVRPLPEVDEVEDVVDPNPGTPTGPVEGAPPAVVPVQPPPPAVLPAEPRGETADAGSGPPQSTHFSLPPLQTALETYELLIPQATLDAFNADPKGAVEQPATFVYDGVSQPVLARLRGNSSRRWPKKSWRVEFPEGVHFQGRSKLDLMSEWIDASLMVEKLGYDLLAALDVPASRAKYVRLVINGQYQGVYLDLENVGKRFARAHGFVDDDVTVYRCGMKNCEMKTWLGSYQDDWEKKTHELEPFDDIRAFERLVSRTPEPDFPEALARHFELDDYLRNLVVDALISNAVIDDSQSFLVHDRVTGRWSYVPWDLNNSTTRYEIWMQPGKARPVTDRPLVIFSVMDPWVEQRLLERRVQFPDEAWLPIYSNLGTRVALNPELRERMLTQLERALEEVFTEEVLFPRIAAMKALLVPHVGGESSAVPAYASRFDDPRLSFPEKLADADRYLKAYVSRRREFLQGEVARLRALRPGLTLDALDPAGGWVELRNRSEVPVDTTGLVLTTNLRVATTPNVPARVLLPGESLRLTATELGLAFAPEGELGLFTGKSEVGALDVLFYGPLAPGRIWARSASAPEGWEVR